MKLYDIKQELVDLYENLLDESGEISEETVQKIEEATVAKEEKEENTALYVKSLDYDIKALKEEKKRIDKKIKSAEKTKEWLKNMLMYSLDGEKINTPQVTVSYRKSESVKVDDEFVNYAKDNNLAEFIDLKITPKKAEIKKLLKAGEEMPYCELEVKQNIQIR